MRKTIIKLAEVAKMYPHSPARTFLNMVLNDSNEITCYTIQLATLRNI